MKTTRFNVALNGLTDATRGDKRLRRINNAIDGDIDRKEEQLLDIADEKEELLKKLAEGDSIGSTLQSLAELFVKEKKIKEAADISREMKVYINETVDVENKKEEEKQ